MSSKRFILFFCVSFLYVILCVSPTGAEQTGAVLGWGFKVLSGDLSAGFTDVAANVYRSLGLKADGSIVAWGRNDYGQCNLPSPNTGFTALAAGYAHSLGLKADGSIVAWGDNGNGQCNVPAPNTGFIALAAGWSHSLGLKGDGSIVAWGSNGSGRCNVPAPNSGFTALAAGSVHSLGLKADGSIVAWGNNDYGQCNLPAPNSGFIALAAGYEHSLGLKADGSIVAWGWNNYGQCNVPAPNSGFTALAAGWYHSLGLKADGSVVAWGAGQPGQSGWPHYGQCNVPAPNTGFIALAAGHAHSLGLKADGSIVAWGDNDYGQCHVPAPNSGFIALAAGSSHSLGLKADGSIVAWGNNGLGQCDVPAPNTGFTALAAGYEHSLGLKADGSIFAWGRNYEGQCNVPAPNTGFIALAGAWHSLGLKADGSIVAWGDNSSGQCNVPAPNIGFIALAAGSYYSLGLKEDGSIVAWGNNSSGQCNVPAPNSGFIALAAGWYHSLGLKADGSIVAWGNNDYGQCNVPAPNSSFIALAAGVSHSLGLKADGSIVAWGLNNYGQCNVPAPNTGFIALATGHWCSSLGLKADGGEPPPLPTLKWPLAGEIGDRQVLLGFGSNWTWSECPPGVVKKHVAIDVSATIGENVYAPEAGIVKAVLSDSGHPEWKYCVTIEHSGFTTVCWHIDPLVNVGNTITRGQVIGTIADLGANIHLHFGVRASNYLINVSNVGALPQTDCGGYPAFPEQFVNPTTLSYEITQPLLPPEVTPRPESENPQSGSLAFDAPLVIFPVEPPSWYGEETWRGALIRLLDRISGFLFPPYFKIIIDPTIFLMPIEIEGVQAHNWKGDNATAVTVVVAAANQTQTDAIKLTEASEAFIWKEVTIPDDAYGLSFDAIFLGEPNGGNLIVSFNDKTLFIDDGTLFSDSLWVKPGIIYIGDLAGETGILQFWLKSEGEPNMSILITNIVLTKYPKIGDFDSDNDVDFDDLRTLSLHWLAEDCNYPGWCEGTDLDYSGRVNLVDFAAFANNWLWEKIPADFDMDGDVDLLDFSVLAGQWLQEPGEPSADIAPEIPDGVVDILDLAVLANHWLEGL